MNINYIYLTLKIVRHFFTLYKLYATFFLLFTEILEPPLMIGFGEFLYNYF